MSRNSSGAYSQPSGTPAVSGATIDPTAFNTLISDIGNELSNSLDRGGRGAMTAALNLGGFKGYNAAEPASSSDLTTKNYVDTANALALKSANNLSDLASASTARTNLGITTGTATGNYVTVDAAGDTNDGKGKVRAIPQNSQTAAYTLAASDLGKHVSITTGGITVPAGVFNVGDSVSIFNNSTVSQTVTQASSVTLRLAGATVTGNRTLASYGVCTVLCVASNVFVVAGNVS